MYLQRLFNMFQLKIFIFLLATIEVFHLIKALISQADSFPIDFITPVVRLLTYVNKYYILYNCQNFI